MKVAFLGLGAMGYPIAGHLANAGYDVMAYNRTFEKAQRWVDQYRGKSADSVEKAVSDAMVVLACVGDDKDVQEVCSASFRAMQPGTLFIDHTTASPAVAQEMGELAKAYQIDFIDAPVSGGQAGAENGELTIMCGGSMEAFERACAIMQPYAKAVTHMGEIGAGQATKMVNQVAIAGLLQGLSEALVLGRSQGLDMKKVLSAISQGAAGSWQMSNRGETMIDDAFDFGFAVDWMRKDLAICLAAAQKAGLELSVTKIVDDYYAQIQDMGGNRWDTSSLIRRYNTSDQ